NIEAKASIRRRRMAVVGVCANRESPMHSVVRLVIYILSTPCIKFGITKCNTGLHPSFEFLRALFRSCRYCETMPSVRRFRLKGRMPFPGCRVPDRLWKSLPEPGKIGRIRTNAAGTRKTCLPPARNIRRQVGDLDGQGQ